MNRRAFLALFGSGVAATGLMRVFPAVDLLVADVPERFVPGVPVVGMSALLLEFAREFEHALGYATTADRGDVFRRIGEDGFTDQLNIDIPVSQVGDTFERTWIPAAAYALAEKARRLELTHFGKLWLPAGCLCAESITDGRVSVRGVSDYRIEHDKVYARIDILGRRA